MKEKLKVHPMNIPEEVIGRFFAKADKFVVQIELVEVVKFQLKVDVVYYTHQRVEVMKLIELVDQHLWDEEERRLKETKSDRHV
jgi:hypothetical protein